MTAGRPLKFSNLKELEDKIDQYFNDTPREEWTITGLAIHLDTSRETLCNYQEKEKYFDTIKKAKDFVEYSYELDLKKHGRTGTIFALKNFNWRDTFENQTTLNIPQPLLDNVRGNDSTKKDTEAQEAD